VALKGRGEEVVKGGERQIASVIDREKNKRRARAF
jgi:hypothetical protein